MQPIIYNSLDANAPQLTIAAGTLKTILKACLVTGYGNKPAAGWEIAWEDAVANKMAIRSKNITSIKSVLLINDNAAASATVTAYTDWNSATNTGTGQFATGYFVKQWNSGFTPNWVVIATDKFFYLFIQTGSDTGYMRAMSGFGDAISLRNDIAYSLLLAHSSVSYSPNNIGYEYAQISNNTKAYFPQPLYPRTVTPVRWGDRSSITSKINILSQFVLSSSLSETTTEPLLQLYGMLMPHADQSYTAREKNIDLLKNQLPYKNPILGMFQPWHGKVWIHTDDWGQ